MTKFSKGYSVSIGQLFYKSAKIDSEPGGS